MMMKKPTASYNVFDVVLVPFPFIDTAEFKQRPALIISSANLFNHDAGAAVMAMITSATHTPWPLDIAISDLQDAGLPVQSIIRMKLFTLDERLILKKLGRLNQKDQKVFVKNAKLLLGI